MHIVQKHGQSKLLIPQRSSSAQRNTLTLENVASFWTGGSSKRHFGHRWRGFPLSSPKLQEP